MTRRIYPHTTSLNDSSSDVTRINVDFTVPPSRWDSIKLALGGLVAKAKRVAKRLFR